MHLARVVAYLTMHASSWFPCWWRHKHSMHCGSTWQRRGTTWGSINPLSLPPTWSNTPPPLPIAHLQPQDDCSIYCMFWLCWKTPWQKGKSSERPRACQNSGEDLRKTKCRGNYPINVQLSPCGLMVCVGFGNSSTRLRGLLHSLSSSHAVQLNVTAVYSIRQLDK